MSYTNISHGFLIEANILLDNGAVYNISDSIVDVMVRKRCLEDSFPLYVIDTRTTEEIRNIMRDNEFKLSLRISYYNLDDIQTTDQLDTDSITELGCIFNGIIRIYENPFVTTAAKKEEEIDDADTQITSAPFVYYRISGIPEDIIEINEGTVNNVFKNATLTDALVYLLSGTNKAINMHVQQPTNMEVQESILVPPISLIPAIKYLDNNYYHFYKHPANVFVDLNNLYMYDTLSEDSPKTNLIECNVLSPEATTDLESLQRPQIDENGNIRLYYRNLPSYTTNNKIATHNLGSYTVYYYYDENFNLISRTKNNDTAYEKVRYLWENMKDKSSEILDKSSGMSIIISNINPELINPLSLFRVISPDYQSAQGDYNIGEISYMFSSKDMRHYTNSILLKLLKK